MKKKIILVNYNFTIGDERHRDSVLVSLKYDKEGQYTETQEREKAIETVLEWFEKMYPESKIVSVVPNHAITAAMDKPVLNADKEDGYGADLSIDRIEQLIEETKHYTDRLVLNGWAPMATILHFQKGYYVNTIQDADNKDNYTIIKWDW
jgi:hypothetical protein